MKKNGKSYSIHKLLLLFLVIIYQAGCSGIHASNEIEKAFQKIIRPKFGFSKWGTERRRKVLEFLENKDKKQVIDYKNATFINEVRANSGETALQLAFSSLKMPFGIQLIKELLKFDQLEVNEVINPKESIEAQQTGLALSMIAEEYELAKNILNHPKAHKGLKRGFEILIDAIDAGQVDIVALLTSKKDDQGKPIVDLNKKTNISLSKHCTFYQVTPLMCSLILFNSLYTDKLIRENLKEIIGILAKYSRLDVVNEEGKTALIYAITFLCSWKKSPPCKTHGCRVRVVNFLKKIIPTLSSKENLNIQEFTYQTTALMNAIRCQYPEVVNILFGQDGIDVDIADYQKETALFYAARYYHKDIFEKVLHHTKKLNSLNHERETALLVLIKKRYSVTKREDGALYEEAIRGLLKKIGGSAQSDVDDRLGDDLAPTTLQWVVMDYISRLKRAKKGKESMITELNDKKEANLLTLTEEECEEKRNQINKQCKAYRNKVTEVASKIVHTLLNEGANPDLFFKEGEGSEEKRVITLMSNSLIKEYPELKIIRGYFKKEEELKQREQKGLEGEEEAEQERKESEKIERKKKEREREKREKERKQKIKREKRKREKREKKEREKQEREEKKKIEGEKRKKEVIGERLKEELVKREEKKLKDSEGNSGNIGIMLFIVVIVSSLALDPFFVARKLLQKKKVEKEPAPILSK